MNRVVEAGRVALVTNLHLCRPRLNADGERDRYLVDEKRVIIDRQATVCGRRRVQFDGVGDDGRDVAVCR